MRDLRGKVSKPLSRLAKSGALGDDEIAVARSLENAVIAIQGEGAIPPAPGPHMGFGAVGEARMVRELDDRLFFERWVAAMSVARLPAAPVLDAVVEGKALAAIDRERKKRKGWARRRLQDGLSLAVKLRYAALERKSA
jgi:hypothetical protein